MMGDDGRDEGRRFTLLVSLSKCNSDQRTLFYLEFILRHAGSSQRATVSGTIDNFIIIIERTLFLLVQLPRRRYNARMRVRKEKVVKLLWSAEMIELLVHISGVKLYAWAQNIFIDPVGRLLRIPLCLFDSTLYLKMVARLADQESAP
jgi:hypothetical protein